MIDNIKDEPTKVRMASVQPPAGDTPGYALKMMTTDGFELEFLLDDASLALLSLTAGFAVKDAARRAKNEADVFVFPKEESSL